MWLRRGLSVCIKQIVHCIVQDQLSKVSKLPQNQVQLTAQHSQYVTILISKKVRTELEAALLKLNAVISMVSTFTKCFSKLWMKFLVNVFYKNKKKRWENKKTLKNVKKTWQKYKKNVKNVFLHLWSWHIAVSTVLVRTISRVTLRAYLTCVQDKKLRSASRPTAALAVPATRHTTLGDRAFPVIGTHCGWHYICDITLTFRHKFKTRLFCWSDEA